MRHAESRWSWRDTFIAIAIVLIASSLSPFALADAGAFPHQVFYLAFTPLLALYVLFARSPRINPYIALVVFSQVTMVCFVILVDGREVLAGHLKTIGTLLGVLVVSALFSSDLLDLRVFVRVVVLCTGAVLLLAAVSMVLAYLGYATPVPRFNRAGGEEVVYQVGYTLTDLMYPAGAGYFIRPGGVFMEPGQLAMYASLAIMLNATILRSRAAEALLACLGLFTTSLAFYLFLLAFFILFKRGTALILYLSVFALAVVVAGGRAFIQEDVVLTHVLGRIISFFTETFGGNRAVPTLATAAHLDQLRLLGAAKSDAFQGLDADATVFGPFLTYGLLGGFFAYLHVLLFALLPLADWLQRYPRRVTRTRMPAIFVLLALNLYQRPFTLHFLYYVYLVAMFEWEWRKYAVSERAGALAAAC